MTAMTAKVYCYAGEDRSNPHAVVLELDEVDIARVNEVREREKPRTYENGTFVAVTDQATGARYEVASAPCGLGCHCAMTARPA